MLGQPQPQNHKLSEDESTELFRSLLHKEGSWVDWGVGCQRLQQSGYSSMEIFEGTGFQGSHQNMITVAAQVYQSIADNGGSEDLLAYCRGPRSDVLYELRILNNKQRAIAAQVAKDKNLEFDAAKEVAKAMQHFVRLPQIPDGFTEHPGDAMAYQAWRAAKQKRDLQGRTRLIAKGLKFAHSETARKKIEQLLVDLSSVTATKSAPLLPLFRYEEDIEVPCLLPVAGTLPLATEAVQAIEALTQEGPFNLIAPQQAVPLVPLPSWQSVLTAVDPIVIFHKTDQLPQPIPGKPEPVLLLIDRAKTEWNDNSYFAVDVDGQIKLAWYPEQPEMEIVGQVLVVMRPKKIFDENNLHEPWQMDD
ncbi:MAG: RuBisCO accumulation factor 1 [Limnothrix sp.]